MDDLISRQAAIDALKELTANGTNKGMVFGEDAVHRIEMLPSVQPDPCEDAVSREAVLSMIDTYMNKSVELHYLPTSDGIKKLISILPSAQPDTTTHDSIPAETGKNDGVGTSGDCISRQAAIDALRDYLVEKRCPDDGTLTCRLIENEVINKLPSVQPDDDRLERCRFEYVNACKILAHRTPDTRKNDINDAYAVVRALNPIFGEEGF